MTDICNRCLVNVNATVTIRAKITAADGGIRTEFCEVATNPAALKKWVEDLWYGDNARFEVDATADRFKAISTWYGDPVCAWHLWELVDAERRAGGDLRVARALRSR